MYIIFLYTQLPTIQEASVVDKIPDILWELFGSLPFQERNPSMIKPLWRDFGRRILTLRWASLRKRRNYEIGQLEKLEKNAKELFEGN